MRTVFSAAVGRRSVLVGLCMTALVAARPLDHGNQPAKILFVCQYGTVKSPIARELFRIAAARRGLAVEAFSRGITPEAHLPPALREQLLADGIDTEADGLQTLSPEDLQSVDLVIAFDSLPPELGASQVIDWSDLPSVIQDYPGTRAILQQRIETLVEDLFRP